MKGKLQRRYLLLQVYRLLSQDDTEGQDRDARLRACLELLQNLSVSPS